MNTIQLSAKFCFPGEKPIKCEICKTCFRTAKALQKHRHSNTHRQRAGDVQRQRDYTCNVCGKSYFR